MGPQCLPAKMEVWERGHLVPQRVSGSPWLLGKLTLAMPLGLASLLLLLARGLPCWSHLKSFLLHVVPLQGRASPGLLATAPPPHAALTPEG